MMQGCGVAVVYGGRRCIVTRLSPPSSHSPVAATVRAGVSPAPVPALAAP